MSDPESPPRFYESPWFKGIAAVVALLVGVAALVGPLRGVVDDIFPGSSLPRVEYEIVFDRGSEMNTQISPEETKLTKAKQELKGVVGPITSDGLALRTFGGKCNETQAQEPVVGFGANHNDDVIDEVNQVQSGSGRSDLYGAVTAAIQDFNDLPSDTVKNVYVYVGAIDSCGGTASNTATNIKNLMANRGIEASFKFFTVNLSPEDQADLNSFKSVLPNVQQVPSGTSGVQATP